jgi:hypothetical protein
MCLRVVDTRRDASRTGQIDLANRSTLSFSLTTSQLTRNFGAADKRRPPSLRATNLATNFGLFDGVRSPHQDWRFHLIVWPR